MRRSYMPALLCTVLAFPVAAQEARQDVLVVESPEVAQEERVDAIEITTPADDRKSYTIRITEYQTDSAMDPTLAAGEIVQRLINPGDDQSAQQGETVRMTALSGAETTVQFGRSTNVTTGSMTDGRGVTRRQTTSIEIGTLVKLAATPQGEHVSLELMYESSRLDGDGTDHSPPDVTRTQIRSSYLVEPGKPVLIGGTTAGNSTFVVLTLNQ